MGIGNVRVSSNHSELLIRGYLDQLEEIHGGSPPFEAVKSIDIDIDRVTIRCDTYTWEGDSAYPSNDLAGIIGDGVERIEYDGRNILAHLKEADEDE